MDNSLKKNMDESQIKFSKIKKILIVILVLNWAVALAKIIYGMISRSSSMTADGFHSLSDGTSNVIGIVGITIAAQPRDKDHPYGHKKYETLFSLVIAALLVFVCFNLLFEGIKRLRAPVIPEINYLSFLIMLLTIAVNIYVVNYEYKRGKALKSDILISDSLHTRTDIFISLSVIVALIAGKFHFYILDPIMTIVIALFIARAAWEISKQGSDVLCDTAVILDSKRIEDIVLAVKGVKACHKIRTRGREDDVYIDLHVQVNSDMHMDKAHKISYDIEEALKNGICGVSDVIVHMEPKEKEK